MSWLDSVSLKFLDPYHARILTQYREIHAQAPPQVQGALNTAEEYYNWAMANQDPRVKVSRGMEKGKGRSIARSGDECRHCRCWPSITECHCALSSAAVAPFVFCLRVYV